MLNNKKIWVVVQKERGQPLEVISYTNFMRRKDLKESHIITTIRSEEKPKFEIEKTYAINESNFNFGWISPNCTTFSCGEYGHIGLACRLCEEYDIKGIKTITPDDNLLENGWIKVTPKGWMGWWDKINDKQIEFLNNRNIPSWKENLIYE